MREKKDSILEKFNVSERSFWLLFLVILLTAGFLRFFDLKNLPCGMSPDESDVASIASEGKIAAVFNNPYNEPEGFFVSYLVLLSKILGLGVWQVYLASAFLGWLTVFIAGIAIRKQLGNVVSLMATTALATSTWHIALSQSGTRQVTTPLFLSVLLFFYPTFRQSESNNLVASFLFGVALSIGFYGYLSYRAVVLVVLTAVAFLYYRSSRKSISASIKQRKVIITSFLFGFIFTIVPLVRGYVHYPETFWARSRQVFIFNTGFWNGFKILSKNFALVAKGFLIRGGQNWHQTLDFQPFIPWYFIPFLFLGLFWAVIKMFAYLKNKHDNLLVSLLFPSFVIFLLPDLLTDATPHGARLNGEIPLVYILIAVGISSFLFFLKKININKNVLVVALTIILLFLTSVFAFLTLQKRFYSQRYAIDYFCGMNDIGKYLSAMRFISKKPDSINQIVIVGTWYDTAPLYFYLLHHPYLHLGEEIRHIDYKRIVSGYKLKSGDILIVPAYTTYKYQRIHTRLPTSQVQQGKMTVLDLIRLQNPQLKQIYTQYHPNSHWFPDHISFLVFQM